MLSAEGLENAFRRHHLLGEAVRRAVSVWAEGQVLGFNIAEAGERSNTVTTVTMNGHDPAALQRYCKEKCGVVLRDKDRRPAGPGVPDRPLWARPSLNDFGHARRHQESRSTRSISRTARAEPKPRSRVSGRDCGGVRATT